MNICSHDFMALVISISASLHGIVLCVDYLIGVSEKIEANSIVELVICYLKHKFKKEDKEK